MFKPNGNQDRNDYKTLLMPPEGYRLDIAVGTTYSLDLQALTAVAISLGLAEDIDSKMMRNPISMLNAIQKVSDKILIFCEAGQISMPSKPSSLSILLEKMVIPVILPRDRQTKRYPAFHPKTWILAYVNDVGDKVYRFAVLSRNLTFDRSWDISFSMDSSKKVRQKAKTKPVIDFLEYLNTQVHSTSQNARKKRTMIKGLADELSNVSFSLDSREFGEDFQILPLGIGDKAYHMDQDVLFSRNKSSADYTFHELVVMSPFLTDRVIEEFNIKNRGLTDCRRTLITRRSELGKLKSHQVDNFNIYVLKDELIDGEEYLSNEEEEKRKQDIHAKIYLRRKYTDTALYFGSMNASYSAVHKNVEMMMCMRTKNRFLSGDMFLHDIFCGPADGTNNPFEKVDVVDEAEDKEADVKNELELIIKTFCRVNKEANIETGKEGTYKVTITLHGTYENQAIALSPLYSKQKLPLAAAMVFEDLSLVQLSEFYEVIAAKDGTSIHRIVMIPTTGVPEEREQAIVNSVVKDRQSFVSYIAFVLGDDYLISLMEGKQLGESGFYRQSTDRMPALYEKMLKTSLEAPERLKDIGYILKMVSDKDIVPDEFRETYEVFCNTLKIR